MDGRYKEIVPELEKQEIEFSEEDLMLIGEIYDNFGSGKKFSLEDLEELGIEVDDLALRDFINEGFLLEEKTGVYTINPNSEVVKNLNLPKLDIFPEESLN